MATLQNYHFRARTKTNQVQTGIVQAANLEAAKKILLASELDPLSLHLPKGIADFIPFFNRVSLKDKTMFARQLATMIEAGLSLSQAFGLLIKQSKKNHFQSVLQSIQNDIQDGFSFSNGLARFPEVFDNIFINVIRSGEATGKLETVLIQLADSLEKDIKIQGKIKGAMFYPAFIICAMIIVALVMVTQVIPQLKDVFEGAGQQLPLATRQLLSFSDFLINRWWVLIIEIIVFITALRYFLRSEVGIQFMSRLNLKLPIVGNIVTESTMARFGRLLGMLLGAGVPLLEAMRLINNSFNNRVFQQSLMQVSAEVERGVPMSVPISANPVFPLIVAQMISVGEQTGKMDEVMTRLADYFDNEVESKVSGISTLIEPVVIVLLGVGVAYLVIAILMPIYTISSAVS